MVAVLRGPLEWSMTRDEEGHREYKLVNLVNCSSKFDGPSVAINCPGLPLPGSAWIIGNDVDFWVWCRWGATVTPVITKEPNYWFTVEQTFSNKPADIKRQRCNDTPIEDPILEPNKISGSFTKYTEEAFIDRFGKPITNSAFEQIRGPQIEFDRNHPTIKIEQNVINLGIELWGPMVDTVNDSRMWGLPRRTIKLSNVSWERKFYAQCYKYYTRTFEFDIKTETFDRDLLDEGTKVLSGRWSANNSRVWELLDVLENGIPVPPNPRNPLHFDKFKDPKNNPCRCILNGFGLHANVLVPLKNVDLYISIANTNVNNLTSDGTKWIPLVGTTYDYVVDQIEGFGNVAPPVGGFNIPLGGAALGIERYLFDEGEFRVWVPGEVVLFIPHPAINDLYINITSTIPEVNVFPGEDETVWIFVASGTLQYKGEYNSGTTYSKGDIIKHQFDPTGTGSIHVEKYPESNFLLLGVPLVL